MPSIKDVVEQVQSDQLPVFFLDTCIFLDVIRAIQRRSKGYVASAWQLHQALTDAQPRCKLVVSHMVVHEWQKNSPLVLNEAEKHLMEIEEQSRLFHDACSLLGIAPAFPPSTYSGHGVAQQLHGLAPQILAKGLVVDQDADCSSRAITRIMHGKRPSTEGGREAKDCTILEEYLEIYKETQDQQFHVKCVFCTSNTNDYSRHGSLHEDLVEEFATVGLDFTSNLPWGLHQITH